MNKIKKYYAIKIGKNVRDIIVESWEECSKYVFGCEAIYKGFTSKKEAKRYLSNMSNEQIRLQLTLDRIKKQKKEMYKIQNMFNFKIPKYILEEIVKINQKGSRDYKELYIYIGIATTAGTISKQEAKILKKAYCNKR